MKSRTLPIVFFATIPAGGLMAAGYYLPNQDAFATAKGNAFVATADTAAAVHYNPAGMTQVKEPEAQVGVYSIVLGTTAKNGGVTSEADTELQSAPQVYYVQPFNDRLSFGFGLNSPFGLGTDWGSNTPFSPVITEARLLFASATSAVAYKVTDQLSLGASVSVNYADLTLEQAPIGPGSQLRFKGDDYGVSGTLSAHWQPHEQHAFGLIYSSESSFDLSGKTNSSGFPLGPSDNSSELDFMTPARLAGGYSYRPAPGWNIEANIEWLAWDQLDNLTLQSDSVGGAAPVPFNWQSSFIYELGASYMTPEGYVFAAGYDLNMSSQPDANFNPGVADADRHWFNMGFGKKCEEFSWMLGYQFGYSNRTVTNAGAGVAGLANGKYESRHNALFFSWQQRF
jgi:long-chain fatty acid transport protein